MSRRNKYKPNHLHTRSLPQSTVPQRGFILPAPSPYACSSHQWQVWATSNHSQDTSKLKGTLVSNQLILQIKDAEAQKGEVALPG